MRERWEKEAAAWTGRDGFSVQVLEEVAKARERAGDYSGACRAAREAFDLARSICPAYPLDPSGLVERLARRVARLTKRTAPGLRETANTGAYKVLHF